MRLKIHKKISNPKKDFKSSKKILNPGKRFKSFIKSQMPTFSKKDFWILKSLTKDLWIFLF